MKRGGQLRSEWVIAVQGKVVPRGIDMINPKIKTGDIELEVHALHILSKAKTTPFSISDEHVLVNEELRLKYRYLDMRRGEITHRLVTRHQLMLAVRIFMDEQGFTEVMTPILAKSTPEGARDYLVPSRTNPGSFFALPQSPQIFKQILMIGGLDRYFQIASCFRDEDLRADRQPEFTQIDMEMSFATEEDLFPIIEALVVQIFKTCKGISLSSPFEKISYRDAVEKYGTDKPDLRFGMPLVRIDDLALQSHFSVFLEQIRGGGIVKGICVKGGGDLSRKKIDEYTALVRRLGAEGLAWFKMEEEGAVSSIGKFFDPPLLKKIAEKMEAVHGDLLFFVAASEKITNQALDHLRRTLAKERHLIHPDLYAWAWITDFPLFQWERETGTYASEHHPFTSPHMEDLPLLDTDPLQVRSSSYDLVLNGYEIGSGSQRIHSSELQEKIFHILKLSDDDIKKRFGFFIEALQYGTPPHLGIALGLDRLVMILTQAEGIRDVIAFPKTQKATDLMLEAPSEVEKKQLKELNIQAYL